MRSHVCETDGYSMAEFMMLMRGGANSADWTDYIAKLQSTGTFRGGSALGNGVCIAKEFQPDPSGVTGFMRFEAESIETVRSLVEGNPVFEADGVVEILELVVD